MPDCWSIELNDLKRSVNIRWKFDPVQRSSSNDFFSSCWGSSKLPPSQETNVYTDWSILCSLAHFQGWDTVDKKYTEHKFESFNFSALVSNLRINDRAVLTNLYSGIFFFLL